ncbi:phosphotransferase family protein [Streptomyces sp. NPDC056831]|uniref:phosphotransferase family protein n=1 Tax=Streptomyces sp. NPDC056831 TaxID=3345954 RepID=UPI0036CF4C33
MNQSRIARSLNILQGIARVAGISSEGAEPIRLAENDLWRLPGGVVVRIGRPGQGAAAAREVAVARWLAKEGMAAVRPLPIDQPIQVGEHAATLWDELPLHRAGNEADLAPLLQQLHNLPQPHLDLGELDPFVRIADRVCSARWVGEQNQTWLLQHLDALRNSWAALPDGLPLCVIHGDAWPGNTAILANGTAVLLDFERTSIGLPEWDLTSTAVAADTFGSVTAAEYRQFCVAYGHDVMDWGGYPTLRATRELRLVTFALQVATEDPSARPQAFHRVACVRGQRGPRPWGWTAVG